MDERLVLFSLIAQSGFTPDVQEQKELDEMARKRDGIYHGKAEAFENDLKTLKFIIEDVETGDVYEVDPKLVKFKKETILSNKESE